MKIGDVVNFWFVHTTACLDDCEVPDGESCACVAERFVSRPAEVRQRYVDDGARMRDQVAQLDALLAQDDSVLLLGVDPTDPSAETAAERRARYEAAREEFAAQAAALLAQPRVSLDLDVQFVEEDMADFGFLSGGIPITLAEYRARGLALHSRVDRASTNPPTAAHDSGTWTE